MSSGTVRAALYARVSSEQQAQAGTIDSQLRLSHGAAPRCSVTCARVGQGRASRLYRCLLFPSLSRAPYSRVLTPTRSAVSAFPLTQVPDNVLPHFSSR
jgi:hypothetical protein